MRTLKLRTNRKDLPIHGLDKIPDEVIIEKLRVELGQANSYIDELEEEKKAFKRESDENRLQSYKERIQAQKKEIVNLRQTISQLVTNSLKSQI